MHTADIEAIDRLADREMVSRANYCRRVLKNHLRTATAASPKTESAP